MNDTPEIKSMEIIFEVFRSLGIHSGQDNPQDGIISLFSEHETPLLLAEALQNALGPKEDVDTECYPEKLPKEYVGDLYVEILEVCRTIVKKLGFKSKLEERSQILAAICACRYKEEDITRTAEIFGVEVYQLPVYKLYIAFAGSPSADGFIKKFFSECRKKRVEL